MRCEQRLGTRSETTSSFDNTLPLETAEIRAFFVQSLSGFRFWFFAGGVSGLLVDATPGAVSV